MSDPIITPVGVTFNSGLPNPDNEGRAKSLAQGIEFDDPKIYDLFDMLIEDIYKAALAINPRPSKVFGLTGTLGTTDFVHNFQATLINTPSDLRLTWNALVGASSYEIRYKSGTNDGTVWNTATSILTTNTLQADVNPFTIPLTYGNHTFLIKATSTTGVSSSAAAFVVVNIPQITAPSLTITVIDNFVLLKWIAPSSSFHISYYNVYKNSIFTGKMDGTFEAIFETTAGSYTYGVEAVDDVGNVSIRTSLTTDVKSPADFTFQDIRTSTFTGTKVNCAVQNDGGLAAPIDTATDWQTHFSSHAWTDIIDQINAGYPIYIQPTLLTASYEEVVDFGTTYNNVIATLTWVQNLIAGSVSVVAKLATSTDNITYTAFTTGSSLFAASLRYVKFRFEFTASNDHGLVELLNVQVRLDVKREVDSGSITADKNDANGTLTTFNKLFKSIDSITLTVNSVEPVTAIYASVTITNFRIFAMDSQGNRITYTVSWKARGIV